MGCNMLDPFRGPDEVVDLHAFGHPHATLINVSKPVPAYSILVNGQRVWGITGCTQSGQLARVARLEMTASDRCNWPSCLRAGGGAVFERRDAGHLAEERGEIFARAEATGLGHLWDRQIGGGQELLGPLDPHATNLHRR